MTFQQRRLDPELSPSHRYGAEIRMERERAGLSVTALAGILGFNKSQMSKFENGEHLHETLGPKLDIALGTGVMFTRMFGFIRFDIHPGQYRRYMRLEAEASAVEEYAAATIPGLLQTPAYAKAFLSAFNPDAEPAAIDKLVAARLSRQERLQTPDRPQLCVILDEASVRRPIGGAEVMCEQLRSLLPLVDANHTTIQVLPFSHGAHPVLGGSLILLALPDELTIAYLEGSDSGQLIEDLPSVAARARAFASLRSHALPPRASAAMITAAIKEFETWGPPTTRARQRGARVRTATAMAGRASRSAMISRASSRSATRRPRVSDT